jgi:phosphoribosylglycinamide formyltransferase-1
MLKIGVMVSGGGTNLQAIIDSIESGYLKNCSIVTVISSRANAFALKRAERYHIPAVCIPRKNYRNLEEYDNALIAHLKKYDVGLVVMAGYLSIVGEKFINEFSNRIINIHPSLIPAFCGKGYYGIIPHEKALEYGVKVTGATVHFVTLEPDAGPIILQKAIYVKEDDTPEVLQKRVMQEAEWEILPEAIKLFSEGSLIIEGRKVRIDKNG